jgi:hypothetical protein
MAGDRQQCPPDSRQQSKKLQILVLHGSRQDGEVFSQRLKTLTKKLKNIAVSGLRCWLVSLDY